MSSTSDSACLPLTYVTQPGDSTMGIALRQLRDEALWTDIRDLNTERFPEMGPHDYFPVGTTLVIRRAAGASAAAAMRQAFLTELDAELERLETEYHNARARVAFKRILVQSLPELPLAPAQFGVAPMHRTSDAQLLFKVKSRDEVLALVDALPGVPLVMLSAGCTSFEPAERHRADALTRVTPVGEVVYRLSTWVGSLREEFTWYTLLDGRLVEVRARTADGVLPEARARVTTRDTGPDEVEATWSYTDLPAGELLVWHGGDRSNVIPLTVHQRPGQSLREAFAAKQAVVKTVRSHRCAC